MAIVNRIEKRVRMSKEQAVKYQLMTYCFIHNIPVSEADLRCLSILAREGEQDLTSFCTKIYELNIFKSVQTVRNAIRKAEVKGLITKVGKNKKKISISPEVTLHSSGSILVNYQILALENEA